METPRRRINGWALAFGIVVLASLPLVGPNVMMVAAALPYEYRDVRVVPERPVGMVFGGDLEPDGTVAPLLARRVDAGIALYRARKVRVLLFTGDGGSYLRDETKAMVRYALARGLDAKAIVVDGAGMDTYDSCYRAARVYEIRSAILVTQAFHLPRALMLCRTMGIDAVGLTAADPEAHGLLPLDERREILARVKAIWPLFVTHRPAPVVGPAHPIPT